MQPQIHDKLLAVLDYWHKVEFFIPYGLDQQLDDLEQWQAKRLFDHALDKADDITWRQLDVPDSHEITGYYLNLGVFDKSALVDLCQQLKTQADDALSAEQRFEEEARADLEGATCFARLALDMDGALVPDSISISTAPWAIGQTRAGGLESLGYEAFELARGQLVACLENFLTERKEFADLPLVAADIRTLHQLLCEWAGFTPPAEQPLAVVEARVRPRKNDQAKPADAVDPSGEAVEEDDEEDDDDVVVEELGILNSFYIQDIERAINSVRNGSVPEPLLHYLIPRAGDQRIDLYTDEGRSAIVQALRPARINEGHWFANPAHPMSLMQQFALNRIGEDLQQTGLFSVNGPPGTGKTTLLRDVFANNIVQRARVLATLAKPADAFVGSSMRVRFKGDDPATVWPLIEALTGFEMVVASSNNAAVENISVDLVKRKEQDPQWGDVGYLQPVAHNLAVQTGRQGPVSPTGDQMPWGLISCALGNSRNRRHFVSRVSGQTFDTGSNPLPKTIWSWFRDPAPHTFQQASAAFKVADRAVKDALAQRERLAAVLEQLAEDTREGAAQALLDEVERVRSDLAVKVGAAQANERERTALAERLQTLEREAQLLERTRPVWWEQLLKPIKSREWARRYRQNADSQLAVGDEQKRLRALDVVQGEVRQAREALDQAQARQAAREQRIQALEVQRDALQAEIGLVVLPQTPGDLELDGFQKDGLWHDAVLAGLRSDLFAAALNLQQAWVHAVGQDGGQLRSNLVAIFRLLQNRVPENLQHALPIWQNLFMVVPVVSSTFASFARQFHGLQPGSLGWVFIDEAGQAVPQAAVGALWRARRCVVVGDPLQIEPVFTLPGKLIDALGAVSPVELGDAYAPHRVSVQRLADQANRFGTYATLQDQRLWIGSPLRVHRRCHDPMFAIANSIAYDDKMVFGLGETHPPREGALIDLESCWVHIAGAVSRKQVVPEQIEFVTKVITSLYQRDGRLPELYVISPFKAVRQALHESVLGFDWKKTIKRGELNRWVRRNIGTVHTFQGKEQKTVFMVLGADRDNAGGAQWASSRPNLFNVALTRAKHRFYLVGDHDLWGELPHFSEAARGKHALPRVTRAVFKVIRQGSKVV